MAACPIATWPTVQAPVGATLDNSANLCATFLSDDLLVEMARRGDANAFDQLMKRHQKFCLAKAFSILRNFSDAEDEVQSAWMRIWTRLDAYTCQGTFRAWVARIVCNECLMRKRKAGSFPTTSVDEVVDSQTTFRLEVIDQSVLPEQAVANAQVRRVLNEEICAVPLLLRTVLVMRDLHELEMEDIAEDLGISLPAAKSRLLRARAELKKRLVNHSAEGAFTAQFQSPERGQVAYVRQ